MQVLGERNKRLLIIVAILMLIAVGVSFAVWDSMSAFKADNGELSAYANAEVGDEIEFGMYYQTENKTNNEYDKTPIEWIVVDKDERTGQLTLMSKYILAAGSYFGNYYINTSNKWEFHYSLDRPELGGNAMNQAYVESTARAYLNNLERRDLGGDSYISNQYKTSVTASNSTTGELLSSVGFSNRIYTVNGNSYQRPITNIEYKERPATRGFYDEAFSESEKSMIVPKEISGYIGFRWPTSTYEASKKTFVEGVVDKVWLPSTSELNIMGAENNEANASDEAASKVFAYFKGMTGASLQNALRATRTPLIVANSKAMNYSIPLYQYQSTEINTDIHDKNNSTDYYWTRSAMSKYSKRVLLVHSSGSFGTYDNFGSDVGVRPCIILKY